MGKIYAILREDRSIETFLDSDIHKSIPKDAVEITRKQHLELLTGEATGKKSMALCSKNNPLLRDLVVPDVMLAANARRQRDALLAATDGIVARHRDQVEEGGAKDITDGQYRAMQSYRRALRDLPTQKGFPASISWPKKPG